MNAKGSNVLIAAIGLTGVALFGASSAGAASGNNVAGAGAEVAGAHWPVYHKDYAGQRFSALDEIDVSNVASLREICRVPLSDGGSLQTGPLVVAGVMYVTTARDTIALDPTNCNVHWKSEYNPVGYEPFPVNRGVAYLNGMLFRGTPDGHLLALDAKTGKVIWDNTVVDSSYGEFLAAAPIAWNGLVYIGSAGSDWGIRGRMMAFDAQTGREAWRFYTIPRGKEKGAETWKMPESAKFGGGGTWTSYTLDVRSGELFVPVGNPAPDLLPDERPGDNLFTNSIVVLDAATGKLKWWYQGIKNDPWDYDMSAPPMLYQSKTRKDVLAAAGKDGYLHLVDRDTHKLLTKTAVTTQKKTAAKPTKNGAFTCPGLLGGTQWNGPAYDEKNHAVIVGSVDWCTVYKAGEPEYVRGQLFYGGIPEMAKDPKPKGWITSVDAETGAVRWKHQTNAPVVAAVTPTAGGVIFSGDTAGNFFALDSASGELLLTKQMDGAVGGGIITYTIAGKQYVAAASGNVSRITFGGAGVPSIIVMGL
ncbi:PQQ-binding-like beta-propeller repeat protein [Aromatoleum toluclasticum]|uniref:pyrroloquinoline quinone-dependent dehydrogenase n=1 Tax=Aromatoleum toluclasticum TaxID=92003 RepID=UPI001D17E664|nr:PQQ-binding-like beta-propeller repeat protein [Aromatoleum toluclasticum]MCC4118455.1 PQQ-binding-like beta-propeller repeat protein [Aromatoleum toluclasticum]